MKDDVYINDETYRFVLVSGPKWDDLMDRQRNPFADVSIVRLFRETERWRCVHAIWDGVCVPAFQRARQDEPVD